MNDKRQVPSIPAAALKDYAKSDRIERVWRRLDSDLPSSSQRQRAALWWAPAAVVIIFGAGVFVGTRWAQPEVPVRTTFGPEPAAALEPAAAPEAPRAVSSPEQPRTDEPTGRQRQPLRSPIAVPVPGEMDQPELVEPLPAPEPVPTPEWQRLASAGRYEAARKALEAHGGFDVAFGRASAEQLMLLHDLARIEGRRALAIEALRRVVSQHRQDPNAELAAYTLGTMLEKDGKSDEAAKAFALYRELAPKGDLAEDVLVRQVEVALERGDLALARRLADQYAKDFPNGDGLDKHLETLRATDQGTPAAAGDAGVPAETPEPEGAATDESESPEG